MSERLAIDLDFSEEEIQTLTNIFPKGVCAFDFEMTGLSPVFDKIIEIAAVKITPAGEIETFHSLVNPLIEVPEYTIEYHGLDNEILRDAPSLKKPLKDFVEFYGDMPLIAHGAIFDTSFLVKALHEFHYPIALSDILDSCRLARAYFKSVAKNTEITPPENYKLSTLANYYNLRFEHHQALDDAFVALKVFAKILKELPSGERHSQMRNFAHVFKLKDFKRQESYALPKKLEVLKSFLQTKTPIEIKYSGGKRKEEFRPVTPIALLPMPQGLMLYGICMLDNLNKYFQTKKIKAIREIEK